MAKVVVVQHDRARISEYASALKAAGHEVKGCCGPETFECPVVEGRRCAYCEEGEVLVYDPWLQPAGEESDSLRILGMLRFTYPGKPIVVAGGYGGLSAEVRELAERDPMVWLLPTPTEPARVVAAVAEALAVLAPGLPEGAPHSQMG